MTLPKFLKTSCAHLRLHRTLASLCLGLTLGLSHAFGADLDLPPLADSAQETILSGEPYVDVWRNKSRPSGVLDIYGAIDIDATPQAIWGVMLDCDLALIAVPAMTECSILETDSAGAWDVRRQKIKVGPLLPKSNSTFKSVYDENTSIRISLIDGNLKYQEGLWVLRPLSDTKTRLIYRAAIGPKFPVPRGIIKVGIENDVPVILDNLRRIAEDAQIQGFPIRAEAYTLAAE